MAYVTPGTVAAGDVATAAAWNVLTNDVIAHQASIIRLGFQTRGTLATSDHYTATQTAVGSATDIFPADISWTADGTSSYVVEAYCPSGASPTSGAGIYIHLVTGAGTSLGKCETYSSSGGVNVPMFIKLFYTPSAGTATVNARGTRDGVSNGELRFGGGYTPGYIAVYGPPTV